MRQRRRALPDDTRAKAHAAMALRLEALIRDATSSPRLQSSPKPIVALYAPTRFEASPLGLVPIFEASSRYFAWPRIASSVDSPTRLLDFHTAPLDALVRGPHGIRQPLASAPQIAITELALIVVPGLAFDPALNRLGQGGGFYDATLTKTDALKVGLAYECQRVDAVPVDPHDLPVDILVTELATYLR